MTKKSWQLSSRDVISKIVSTIQGSANAISANTFLSRDKCLECLASPFMYSYQTICKTLDSVVNWTCHVSSVNSVDNVMKLSTFTDN